ncbi:MAG: multifunctional CCA addition/repair protein [Congregibacter sp.]
MQTFLVGGAVRDALLELTVTERDWVVVGATAQQMKEAGFRQVGKDFPVFLHPDTKEEYALARTERKQGHGYTGFEVHFDPSVSLEEDLRRRDLTVNAIAQDSDGMLIDPYGGRKDLEDRRLRHVSEAFTEDPLRVLRVARFAARYAHLGFGIAPETLRLMAEIVGQGELAHLPSERIWVETERALRERNPQVFIQTLLDCGALQQLMPEVAALFGVPQRAEHHPEIDTGAHMLLVLEQAALLSSATSKPVLAPSKSAEPTDSLEPADSPEPADSRVVFAALTHDLGKAVTPKDILPSHRGHEHAGLPLVDALCDRLKVPNSYRQLALNVCAQHLNCHRAGELRGSTLLKLLEATGAMREQERFELFLLACEADSRGRTGFTDRHYPQAHYLRRARSLAVAVTADEIRQQDKNGNPVAGKALGEAIRAERVHRLNALRTESAGN